MTSINPATTADVVAEAVRSTSRRVLICGNPNVGKTTLYNLLTNETAHVSNYPGVTVERRAARLPLGEDAEPATLIDVPGAYSLSARSKEEQVAIDATLGLAGNPRPDLCVVVVDAGQLLRNLYLLLQLIELEVSLVVALNMSDEADEDVPKAQSLSQQLGVPVVATSGRTGEGLELLRDTIRAGLDHPPHGILRVHYPPELLPDIETVKLLLPRDWYHSAAQSRGLALWALTSIDEDDELRHIPEGLRRACLEVHEEATRGGRDLDLEIVGNRYRALDRIVDEARKAEQGKQPALVKPELRPPRPAPRQASEDLTNRLDSVLLHPIYGFAIFIVAMLLLFQSLFSWADPAIGAIEEVFSWLQGLALAKLPDGFIRDLIVEGVLGGVGNVVVFLPQIMMLFLFISVLESSGYMARVAYLMDRIMRSVGLHGRAFVPILSGMACAVPAVMATRTMERERDRLLTMMVVPLMSCSARLPVYGLLIAALFPPSKVFGWLPLQGGLMMFMYVFSLVMTLLAAAVLGRTTIRGKRVPLILELPRYRFPSLANSLRSMWSRSKVFLTEAGTVILGFTILLWLLASYPKLDASTLENLPPEQAQAAALQHSYAGQLGHAIEPAIEPLGFDWKIGVGLVGAFAAREVFVSTMGLVYGVGEVAEDATEPLRDKMRAETRADGEPVYTPLTGLSLMVFFALACQCMSTLAAVRRETQSWRWPAFLFSYMTALAWVASLVVYQGGRLLGFE